MLDKPVILLLKLLLDEQFLFPSSLQCPGDEPMLWFDGLDLSRCSLDFVGSSFSPLLPQPIQLGPLLLYPLSSSERQL